MQKKQQRFENFRENSKCGNDFRRNAKTNFLVLTLVTSSAMQELDELKLKKYITLSPYLSTLSTFSSAS
jgi:hypothetical protein